MRAKGVGVVDRRRRRQANTAVTTTADLSISRRNPRESSDTERIGHTQNVR